MKRSFSKLILIILIIAWFRSSTAIAADPGADGFIDTAAHWAKDYISCLTGNGAIKGFTDGTFRPNDMITRAEFTAILLRALKNDVGQPKEGKWYTYYITEATNRKYILSGEFDSVEKNITRGEMARMIVRTMDEVYPGNMDDYASQLSDYGKTPVEYKEFALKAYVKGIITGRPGGVFAYGEQASRAEATTMLVRLIDAGKRAVPAEPVSDDVYMYELDEKKEIKVGTSHPELIVQIKNAIEILKDYATDIYYSKDGNVVQFYLFKDVEELQKNILERVPILKYSVFTEYDPRSEGYRPYSLTLFDTKSTFGQDKFKAMAKEIFPEGYDKILKELQNKIKDTNYQGRVWERINGREIRIFTFAGTNQISMYMELKDK